MSAAAARIKLGLTLYSLTPEFHSGAWSLGDLVHEVAERGLGPGVEMVGFQSIKGFPQVPDQVARDFRDAMAAGGLEQSCLSLNADIGRRHDRFMTEDENVEVMEAGLAAAAKLGFPTIRFQWGTSDAAILRLLPTAERLGVKMGCEVHSPQTVDHPRMVSLLELCEKTGSPYLGFIPDFGSSVRQLPPSLLNAFRERGLPAEAIALVESTWAEDRDGEQKRNDLRAALREMRIGDNDITLMVKAISLFGRQDIERWADVMPHVVHVHAKFFEVDERGEEPAVDYPRIVQIFTEGGYKGYFSSEYEAWHWVGTPDGFTAVARHHALLERCLAESRIGAER